MLTASELIAKHKKAATGLTPPSWTTADSKVIGLPLFVGCPSDGYVGLLVQGTKVIWHSRVFEFEHEATRRVGAECLQRKLDRP